MQASKRLAAAEDVMNHDGHEGHESKMRSVVLGLLISCVVSLAGAQTAYDLVIARGRVIDPETGFDQVADIAIAGNTIVRISRDPLRAQHTVDASGLVVAPGFIDLHSHGQ